MKLKALINYGKRFEPELILFILCFIVLRVGLSIQLAGSSTPLFWPATALAFSAIVIYGYRLWWPVLLAIAAAYMASGSGIGIAVCAALGTTIEVLLGAYILRHIVGFKSGMARLRDNIGLILTACFVPLIGSGITTLGIWLFSATDPSTLATIWSERWSGDTTSLLIIVPLLLKWLPQPLFRRSGAQYVELIFIVAATSVLSLFIFWTSHTEFAYYVFIPLMWMALRTGPRGITLGIFTVGAIAILGTLHMQGPYAGASTFQLELFLGTLSVLFLIFTSVVEEHKNAEKELGRHVEELEQALSKISSEDEAKKNFLAILAHELRNPLAAMLSSIELLRLQKTDRVESYGLVRTIGEHVHAMRSMLDDVLDISRISRNKLTLRKETLPLEPLIEHAVESTQTLIRNRRHRLIITKPDSPLFVDADPIRIEQILVNLLNNAAKYTSPGGVIEIRARAEKNMAVIKLKDNGLGISKAMMKRIFEPFFQVRRGKLATEGLGVGLPLTRQLVEMHGGTIEVRSTGEGKGSEFTVRLPLAQHAHKKINKQQPLQQEKGQTLRFVKNKKSILVVDDNEAAANALSRLLQLRGHDVGVAYTGLSGIEAARQGQHDILILDIGLPDIDGYEVARRLQQGAGTHSALIALTGYGQAEDKERAYNAGFHHHLTKPVDLKELEYAFKKVAHVYEHA